MSVRHQRITSEFAEFAPRKELGGKTNAIPFVFVFFFFFLLLRFSGRINFYAQGKREGARFNLLGGKLTNDKGEQSTWGGIEYLHCSRGGHLKW